MHTFTALFAEAFW